MKGLEINNRRRRALDMTQAVLEEYMEYGNLVTLACQCGQTHTVAINHAWNRKTLRDRDIYTYGFLPKPVEDYTPCFMHLCTAGTGYQWAKYEAVLRNHTLSTAAQLIQRKWSIAIADPSLKV